MYTFKQAVKDSKKYLDKPGPIQLMSVVGKRETVPTYREIILAVDDCYRLFFKRLLYHGALYKLYHKRKSLNDNMVIPEVLVDKIIPLLVLFYFCEDFTNDKLEGLRGMILSLIDLCGTYIDREKIPKRNYKEIQGLEID